MHEWVSYNKPLLENPFNKKWFYVNLMNIKTNSVSRGIKLFKENETSDDAMIHFNKALAIDEENVDGLVARGAL